MEQDQWVPEPRPVEDLDLAMMKIQQLPFSVVTEPAELLVLDVEQAEALASAVDAVAGRVVASKTSKLFR